MIRDTELAGLCQTIARDTGLEVTVGGEGSFITPDGKRLNIAAMPMTHEGRLVAVGLAWHEVGHKLYTEMEGGPGLGLFGNLVNVIEDVREERDFILDRPGAAYDLDAVTTFYASRGHMMPTDATSAVIALTMGHGRLELLGQKAMEPARDKAREILEENFGGAFLALAEGILKGFHSMPTGKKGTESSKDMARQLVQLLEDTAANPPPPAPSPQQQSTESDTDKDSGGGESDDQDDSSSDNPENGTGDEQDDQPTESEENKDNGGGNNDNEENQEDSGEDAGQSQQQNGDDNGQDGQSTGSDPNTEDAPGKGTSPGNSSNNSSNDSSSNSSPGTDGLDGNDQDSAGQARQAQGGTTSNSSPSSSKPSAAGSRKQPDLARIIEKMIEEGAGDFGDLQRMAIDELDRLSAQVTPIVRSTIPQLPRVDRIKPNGPGLVDEFRCITTTSRMRAKLMGLLQAVKRLPERFGVSGRKLAVNRLVRMATGDPRIFRKRIESIAVNTAVVVLLDRSSSMNEISGSTSRIGVARNAAFSLHHALSGIGGVAVHSVAFEMQDATQETPPIKVLCNWGQKPHAEYFGVSTGYMTPTPWALWYARNELLLRSEPRKVVLLVTDGEPFGWGGIETDTRAATARLYRDGIEIAAIGIETDTVQDYWKNNRVIQDIDELPQAMFAVMTDLLTRKAA